MSGRSNNPNDILQEAIDAQIKGDFRKAEERFRILLEDFPGDANLHVWLGHALKAQHKFDEAIDCFTTALEIHPSEPKIMNSLGTTLHDQGRSAEAEKWYRNAIAVAPDFVEAQNNLGCALLDEGRGAEAIPYFENILQIAPHNVGAAHNLHNALFDDQNLDAAASVLEKALRTEPGWQSAHFNLGVIRELQGDMDAANAHFSALDFQGTSVDRERERLKGLLESWDYVRKVRKPQTRFFGDGFATLKYAISQIEIEGLHLEFGVGFGQNINYIAGLVDGQVHGFDSFAGLPDAWEDAPVGGYSTSGIVPDVPDNVDLHAGWFSDTLPPFLAHHEDSVSFVNVDCDIYSSTKIIFDHLGNRVIPGTIVVFDEYFAYPGWQEHEFKAFQEAVDQYSWRYDYLAFSLISRQAVVKIL